MGMYDTLTIQDDLVRCAANHVLREFQTKDLDCVLNRYIIFDRCLFIASKDLDSEENSEFFIDPRDAKLKWALKHEATPTKITMSIAAYTNCEKCVPVFYESSQSASWGDRIGKRSPWIEAEIKVKDGLIIETNPIKIESRDEIKAILRKDGLEVIDDNDRVVKKMIKEWY